MADAADRPCRELAYGDVKRVELAIALANDPRLLLMDEPTAGMAPRERNELIALVKRLVIERGISVLFTEHSMDVVFAFADRIIVLARGRLIADGNAEPIRDNRAGAGGLFRHRQDLRGARPSAADEPMLDGAEPECVVWRRAQSSTTSSLRGRPRRGGGADGPQRRRQIDHHESDHGPDRASAPAACTSTARTSRSCKPFEIARRGLGFTPEDRRIFSDLTVMENLDIGRQPARAFS